MFINVSIETQWKVYSSQVKYFKARNNSTEDVTICINVVTIKDHGIVKIMLFLLLNTALGKG